MEWTDEAIILSARQFGEHDAIVEALTAARGRHLGLIRGAHSKRVRSTLETGNLVRLHWRARLDEQLGNFSAELTELRGAHFFSDGTKLSGLGSACAMVVATLPEREAHMRVFGVMNELLRAMMHEAGEVWIPRYVHFERILLEDLGFGLDLTACAATGETHDLVYASPKTGRAVGRQAGEPYRHVLLKLPQFLTDHNKPASAAAVLDGLALTGFFLEKFVLRPHGKSMPQARIQFSDRLAAQAIDR